MIARISLQAVLYVAIMIAFTFIPGMTRAAGNAADLQCIPVMQVCGCGQVMTSDGCKGGNNKYMCPCSDTTNGFTTSGVCVANATCKAQSTGGGGLTDISKLMEGIKGLLDAMKGQQGAGGAGGTGGCTTYTSTSTPSSDPCSYYVPTSDAINTGSSVFNTDSNVIGGSGSGAANSLISSLFGNSDSINSNSNTNTNSTNNTNVSGSINTNTSNTGTNTNNTTSGTNNTNSSTQTQGSLNPGANAGKSQLVFGSSPGIAGDVQIITGNKVTVLASNREVTNGRQTTGFYGYTAAPNLAPKAIYTNLCMLRPWASNFLSFIMPSNYLDSLCSSNGFTVGMPTPTIQITQPSTGSIVPKATTNTNTASSTQTNVPQYIGPLRAEIWATPPSVSSGARTSIFWNSNGAIACSLTSNDNAFTGSSLSGHASSQSLTKNTTFSISCQNATSTVSNQVVVTVQ